ncbi:amino acid permease [Carnobacterium divergens]|uniref:amino acid permease n=1 Tax=Carnobacterium divergens TaxID=2748 RepID=UPI0010720A74|nr:amino acid permease [Carnobacterium divergens]TFI68449.1 amino acid permease [Carnobacterium divergens]TFI68646.1 amino acid permease [Carnobacterium divergens]TFI83639.1 amino acid permease [Carnobacterium divergens]TFJ09717.1 amino acid permease [Carnobacterium divergens]TFJ14597.1 amino acid permease [Carnobacterium divergens]
MSYFRKKEIDPTVHQQSKLKKELKTFDLILLGLGAMVGTGIFVITGTAAAKYAGPSLIISFVIAAFSCALSALCYAEFASRVPIAGGAYSYAYTIFGELVGWMTGWLVLCEYLLANASVASGWSGYVHGFLEGLGIPFPTALTASYNSEKGIYVDIIAVLITLVVMYLVMQGAKKALRLNNVMVAVKFGLIVLFLVVGIFYVKPENWTPFAPFQFKGIATGAAIVFFAFLGFDAVSMAAEEVENPQRDIPRGIIGSLAIATILYIVVTLVLTGMVPYLQLDVKDPVAFAVRFIGHDLIAGVISVGAILTLLTVLISMMYGLTRMIYAIGRDGLLPKTLSKVDSKTKTPKNATILIGIVSAVLAGVIPLEQLAQLTNIVTLMAFAIMAAGIIKLRKDYGQPLVNEFKVPFVPVFPIISMAVCFYLMIQLEVKTWIAFIIWLVVGFCIYVLYGYKHSELGKMNKK